MHLICPHCQSPIELLTLPASGEVHCASCGSTFRVESENTVAWSGSIRGRKLGRFELMSSVGAGAFGTVYKAHDPQLDRTVALKVPRAGNLPDGQELDRFLREARSSAQLRHPAIVPVYEVGQEEGLPFLVSDFVEGITLADRLTAGRLAFRDAATLIATVAEALDHAHHHGVIHRDVKPSNIMLRADGTPVVMDFGLAKRASGEVTMTTAGEVLGTPAYMSPEQARGEGHSVDGRSDVYSLGVILYQVLTGDLPFRGNARMLIHQILNDDPKPPRSLNDKVPRDLQTICLKAMGKEPPRRYATAADLAADLRCWLAGEPIAARPIRSVEKAWRWIRRHPAAAALIVATAVAGLALVAAGFSLTYSGQLQTANKLVEQQRAFAVKAQGEAQDALALAVKAEGDSQDALKLAKRYLYILRVSQAGSAWRDHQADQTAVLLDECPPEQRGWEWHYLDQQRHLSLLDLKGHTGFVSAVAYSRDGRIASASGDKTVRVWVATSGQEVLPPLRGHTNVVYGVAFSPDGRHIASASGDWTVRVWDATSGEETHTLRGHDSQVTSVAYSPDGRRIASASNDQRVRVWDATSGQEVLPPLRGVVHGVAFSPDGRRIASASGDKTVRVWDATSGQEVLPPLRGHTSVVDGVAFSPDGRRIASASDDQTVRVWDATSGHEVLPPLKGHTSVLRSVAFSPDGRRIASSSRDRTVRVWDVTTGQELLTLRGHTSTVWGVAYSPDSRRIASASADQTVKVWDAVNSQETVTLRGHEGPVTSVAYSPDGRRVSSASKDQTVKVWDAASGQEALTLHEHDSPITSVAYSPDGRRVVTASEDKLVRVCDATTGTLFRILPGHTGPVKDVAYSLDGRRIASASMDGTVRVWDATTGQELVAPLGHTGGVTSVAFSRDGRRIASASGPVKVWDVASGKEHFTRRKGGHTYLDLSYSPDGRHIAAASTEQIVQVWDAESGQESLTLRGHADRVTGVAYSPDGRRIASASEDQTVKVWDAASGQEFLTLRGHTDFVTCVAFSPDGHCIASASKDGTVRIWDGTPVTPEWYAKRLALADQRWPVWQRQEAADCERQEQWFAAVWHLNQLLAQNPDDGDLRSRRDAVRARLEMEER